MEDTKNLIRIANRIKEALTRLKASRYLELMRQLTILTGQLQELASESKKMGAALVHEWFSAAEHCRNSISRLLSDMPYSISHMKPLTEASQKETPKLSSLVEELHQLQQEFGDMEFDKAENTLSVVTEPITLEDIYLGPFKIQLELDELSDLPAATHRGEYRGSPYYCIALDPHPAATSEEVTHPHVSSDRLCEGEGYATIRAALEEGRLCDFFTLVRSILNTYSPDSPYVSLDAWVRFVCLKLA
jgi:hypothetical protein